MHHLLPSLWLIHVAVAAVWLYEGVWCKLLGREVHQLRVVEALPRFGPVSAKLLLKLVGAVEVIIAIWALTGIWPIACAIMQTLLLLLLNSGGLLWARRIIHDPAGMVVKNFAFLVLVWVSASFPEWR
jgi:hypothetical protein